MNVATFLLEMTVHSYSLDLEIALYLTLTAQTPARLDFLTSKVRLLRVEDLTPTLKHLHLALAARGLTTTSRRQEHTVLIERGHQRGTLGNVDGTVAVDFNIHIA